MAEKLSINIDLSDSRRIEHPNTDKTIKSDKQQKKVEYRYRYDRIFVLVIGIFVSVIALSVFLFDDEEESVEVMPLSKPEIKPETKADPKQSVEKDTKEVISEKHLSTISDEPRTHYQQPIYLNYETINVLDTFYSPIKPVAQQSSIPDKIELKQEPAQEPKEEHLETEKEITESPKALEEIASNEQDKVAEQIKSSEPDTEAVVETLADNSEQNTDFIQIYTPLLSRVKLVSNIYKKEPVNELSYHVIGSADAAKKIYLFTQWDDSTGKTIEHQWWYQGELITSKKFTALGKRWRCYSSKNIGKLQQGKWQVKILDDKDNLLSIVDFNYQIN